MNPGTGVGLGGSSGAGPGDAGHALGPVASSGKGGWTRAGSRVCSAGRSVIDHVGLHSFPRSGRTFLWGPDVLCEAWELGWGAGDSVGLTSAGAARILASPERVGGSARPPAPRQGPGPGRCPGTRNRRQDAAARTSRPRAPAAPRGPWARRWQAPRAAGGRRGSAVWRRPCPHRPPSGGLPSVWKVPPHRYA